MMMIVTRKLRIIADAISINLNATNTFYNNLFIHNFYVMTDSSGHGRQCLCDKISAISSVKKRIAELMQVTEYTSIKNLGTLVF